MKTAIQVLAVLAGTVLLAGCYEEAGNVTVHEAGEYKGRSDPLLESDAESRASTLEDRFNLVQTDR